MTAENKELERLQKEKMSLALSQAGSVKKKNVELLEAEIASALTKVNVQNLEKEIEYLTNTKQKKGSSAAVFKLREKVLGPKETILDAVAIEDPETGFPVHEPNRIKEVSLKYCYDLLTKGKPREGCEEPYERKKALHEERMLERIDNDLEELTYEQFQESLQIVAKKHKNKYSFILKAGNSLLNAIFALFQLVWKSETIPDSWLDSLLIQLYKGKGSKSSLDNIRHIFLRDQTSKLFSQIVLGAAKENLFSNMSKYQIATKPGHRSSEHLFVMFSLMSLYEAEGKAYIINMFDLSKYFDRENIYDCCNELYRSQVKGKVYRLLYTLNKNSRIRVRTPVGESTSVEVGPCLTQGSVEGAVVSAVNLDKGVQDFFHDKIGD